MFFCFYFGCKNNTFFPICIELEERYSTKKAAILNSSLDDYWISYVFRKHLKRN